ncbi:MAG: hypothetical protein CL897_01540 [Dehalococcoidia bacterium]|nr:hypothetical protein [Dehalococcoidia bacterium]HCV00166.1 hypothetical protein [Dehalococcoidia bacterium]|tara:strand:+ start:9380 stop:9925 length:546 start_codon:yes stop_codon:yes gene_type:complete
MSLEEIIIAIIRIVGSLAVLKWAFVGGWAAILIDLSDLFLKNLLDLGGVSNYQAFDKWLDQFYMVTFLIVSLRWKGAARSVAVGLFAFRLAGFVTFQFTGERIVLLAAPNIFEVWFLFVASLTHWRPNFVFSRQKILLFLIPLTALKILQEYALHGGKWLDSFTAIEAIDAIAGWLAAPFI